MLKNIIVAPTTKSKAKRPETFMFSRTTNQLQTQQTWRGQCPSRN